MGTSLALMAFASTGLSVFALIGVIALGSSLVSPNLAALISKRAGDRRAGAALGVQNAANSLGQATGPLLGGILFIWHLNAPYLLAGALLVVVSGVIALATLEFKGRDLFLSAAGKPGP